MGTMSPLSDPRVSSPTGLSCCPDCMPYSGLQPQGKESRYLAGLCGVHQTALGLGRTGWQDTPGGKGSFPKHLSKLLRRVETESMFNIRKAALGLLDRDDNEI